MSLERYRYRCPNGHISIYQRSDGIYSRNSCDATGFEPIDTKHEPAPIPVRSKVD